MERKSPIVPSAPVQAAARKVAADLGKPAGVPTIQASTKAKPNA